MSLYLIIIGSKVLACLINMQVNRNNTKGVKLAANAPMVTKLRYADDVRLFCNAKLGDVKKMMECLETYCEWSGHSISWDKSGVFASKRVHPQFLKQVKNRWGLKKLPRGTNYLGIPLFLSRSKNEDFKHIKERMESKTSSWKCKSLYQMGQATLIKSVAQALPTYPMSIGLLLTKLLDELDSILRCFWWNPRDRVKHY